jgi:triacylglycerol lipase
VKPTGLFLGLALAFVGCLVGCKAPPVSPTPDLGRRPDAAAPRPNPDLAARHAPYPIVLVHGFGGIADLGGLDLANYFHGVADALTAAGFTVYQPQLSPLNSTARRAEELASFVARVLAESGAPKVDLIAHSQGGLDARVTAVRIPDQIGAVVTIGAPNHGSLIADVVLGLVPGPVTSLVSTVLTLLGRALDGSGLFDSDTRAALTSISTPATDDLDTHTPMQPGVGYFSIAGRSNLAGPAACPNGLAPPFIAKWDAYVDPLNPTLAPTAAVINGSRKPPPPNDGLVTVDSARYGTFLGCIPADHFDEVCAEGLPPGGDNAFDCLTFYRDLAHWLVDAGY